MLTLANCTILTLSSCVEVLLIARAVVDAVAVGGQTSLFLACEAGRLDCAQILLSAGADRSLTTVVSLSPSSWLLLHKTYASSIHFFILFSHAK